MNGDNTTVDPIYADSLKDILDKAQEILLPPEQGRKPDDEPLKKSLWPYSGRAFRGALKAAVDLIEESFSREDYNAKMVPTSSGTASIEVALAGLDIPPGTEVIVTPITDPGSVMPILFHNAIPVFADVDPDSGLITAKTVAAVLTERTSAVIAVHLTGSPVDVPGIRAMLENENMADVKIIEDVAQGLGATLDGKPLGTLGDAGCFSLNPQKHLTVGEGGFVIVGDKDVFYRCHNFSDKHRDRFGIGKQDPSKSEEEASEHGKYQGAGHSMRMSTLQGAMLLAQWPDLPGIAKARHDFGKKLAAELSRKSNLVPQKHLDNSDPSFFGFMFRTENAVGRDRKEELMDKVKVALEPKIPAIRDAFLTGSYNDRDLPIYKYPLFQKRKFPGMHGKNWAAELLGKIIYKCDRIYEYDNICCKQAEFYLARSFWIDVMQPFRPADAATIADAIIDVFAGEGFAEDRRP